MKKTYLLIVIIAFTFNLCSFSVRSQESGHYSVYKLENKIGTETFQISPSGDTSSCIVQIKTSDRGAKLNLITSIKSTNYQFLAYSSIGNTSRFGKENIDTTFKDSAKFPISRNGSIKLKELLIAYWQKKGKPDHIINTINKDSIKVSPLDTITEAKSGQTLYVFELQHINKENEIIWLNTEGKALFLATCDTEGDKREIIDYGSLGLFSFFVGRSNQYLIDTYKSNNKQFAQSFENIAIVGGNVVDVKDGKLINNSMILLKDGKISYLGKIDESLIPAKSKIIHADHQYIMPGLWDMHVHLFHPDYLKNALLSGVTTVRDMANEFDFINLLKENSKSTTIPSPTIFRAGIIEGKSADALGAIQASTEEEIAKYVENYKKAGFDQIKIYSKVSKKNVAKIFEQAKINNMFMVGHIPDALTLRYCVENGMKIISHVHYFMNALKWNGTDLKSANQDFINLLKEKGVVVDPTLNVYSDLEAYKRSNYKRVTKFLFDSGVPIVAGTDNGNIAEELKLYVESGFSNLDALKSATLIPAKVMNADQQSGSVEVGKNADLLILTANPLEDINNIKKIKTVIKGKHVIEIN